jgi:multidrug efflux pump subunit AcrB
MSSRASERQLDRLFYADRRLLTLTLAVIAAAGTAAFYAMPRMEDPPLLRRAAIVNTLLPGADAQRVEALVTEKLEDELQEVEEIKEMRSASRAGLSTITIELHDHVTDVDEAWSRVRDKLDDARPTLPLGTLDPQFDQFEIAAYAAIVGVAWDLPSEPNYAILRRRAEELADVLRDIPGTRQVDVFGAPDEEIVVEIRQDQLATLGLTVDEVARQLEASDAKVTAGLWRSDRGNLVLEVDGQLETLDQIRRIPIAVGSEGRFVAVGDLADVRKGTVEPMTRRAVLDGRPGVALGVLVENNQRIDWWRQRLGHALDDVRRDAPSGLRIELLFDQSEYVSDRLEALLGNLLLGAVAVVGVIWFMMGWRNALVVGSALPLASLMVLGGMHGLGIPMHQMSVTGLIIALGLLIDNAIVMVDEVRRRVADGEEPGAAVGGSVRHLALPLGGSTVTTFLSFAPIALMPGPAGEFVSSIAVSVILAVGSSFLLALTITPALAALVHDTPLAAGRRRHWYRDGFVSPRLQTAYQRVLDAMFARPWRTLGASLVVPAAGFVAATTLADQFFPPADRNQFQIELQLPAQAALTTTAAAADELTARLRALPEVETVHWFLGESAPPFYYNMLPKRSNASAYAQAMVQLRPGVAPGPLVRRLQLELRDAAPAAQTLVRQLEQGPPVEAPIELRLFGPDLAQLRELGDQLRLMMAETPHVVQTSAQLSETQPKLSVRVDEQQARLAGLDYRAVARQLDANLEGAVGGSVLEETEELPVRVRVANERRADLGEIAGVDVLGSRDSQGRRAALPLAAIASLTLEPESSTIAHFNGQRLNEVQAHVEAGTLAADVLEAFRARLAASDFRLPAGYRLVFGGESLQRDNAVANLMSSVGVLAVLMVATLVLSFQSFRLAAVIGAVAAMAVGLGMGSLAAFGYPFGFMAIVGTMGLIGVAINDSIVVLAALRENEQAAAGDPRAVRDVVLRATRHVLSTTLTTVAGFLPLLLAGGGFWPPLATAISGGVVGSTLLALAFTPAAFLVLRGRPATQPTSEPLPATSPPWQAAPAC